MKIGVTGTGNMGRALGLCWGVYSNGHEVLFGSHDLSKAKAVAALPERPWTSQSAEKVSRDHARSECPQNQSRQKIGLVRHTPRVTP